MNKLVASFVAALVCSTSIAPAYANETGPHFYKAGDVVTAEGFGQINDNVCDATAIITIGPDTHDPAGAHVDHADYADVVFSNTGAPCNDYEVSARFNPNGDVWNVNVLYLPTSTVICSSGSTVYPSALTFIGNITRAYLNSPIFVNPGCTLDTDISVTSGSISIVP